MSRFREHTCHYDDEARSSRAEDVVIPRYMRCSRDGDVAALLAMTERLMEFNVFIYFAYTIISPLIFLPYWFKSGELNQGL